MHVEPGGCRRSRGGKESCVVLIAPRRAACAVRVVPGAFGAPAATCWIVDPPTMLRLLTICPCLLLWICLDLLMGKKGQGAERDRQDALAAALACLPLSSLLG